jgi:hypothetical protein
MPRVDATIDDDLFALLEAEAERRELSKAALLRNIIQEHFSAPQATGTGAEELKVLTAKVDAVARYLCISRPLDERLLSDEAEAAKKSWAKWKGWVEELSKADGQSRRSQREDVK